MRRQKSARSHTSVAVAPQIRQQGSRVVSYHQEQMKNTRMMTLITAEMTDSKAQLSSFQLKARHIFFLIDAKLFLSQFINIRKTGIKFSTKKEDVQTVRFR